MFLVTEVDFLGFHVSDKGVFPLPSNIQAIKFMPDTHSSRTTVRRCLGMANCYVYFVPHFASVASPLHSFISGTVPSHWHLRCSTAKQATKQLLSQAPVLYVFNPSLTTCVTFDASLSGVGAVLEQQQPDGWHPVHLLSKTSSDSKRNYSVLDEQWRAVVYAMNKWRHYLQQHFALRADHKPLVSIRRPAAAPTCMIDKPCGCPSASS